MYRKVKSWWYKPTCFNELGIPNDSNNSGRWLTEFVKMQVTADSVLIFRLIQTHKENQPDSQFINCIRDMIFLNVWQVWWACCWWMMAVFSFYNALHRYIQSEILHTWSVGSLSSTILDLAVSAWLGLAWLWLQAHLQFRKVQLPPYCGVIWNAILAVRQDVGCVSLSPPRSSLHLPQTCTWCDNWTCVKECPLNLFL